MNDSQALSEGPWDEVVSQGPRAHGVMSMPASQAGGGGAAIQHVFELIPAAPSLLSESLASPPHSN